MATNAITLLKTDHGNVENLFVQFEAAADGDYAEKRRIVNHIIEQLSRHAAVEEQVFYPALRGIPDLHGMVMESLEEHHAAKLALSELEKLPANAERFDAKTTVLIENVRHHVEEEENELFPLVEKHIPFSDLQIMAGAMEDLKAVAPTRPHPLMPDQPPFNVLVGVPVAIVDMGMKAGIGAARMAGAALLQVTGLDRVTRRETEAQVRKSA
ncbi:MAG: hemerythrin domain-containing protein [Acidimicrobiales bacterium]